MRCINNKLIYSYRDSIRKLQYSNVIRISKYIHAGSPNARDVDIHAWQNTFARDDRPTKASSRIHTAATAVIIPV